MITGLTLDADGMIQAYSGGDIAIFEDNVTAADYLNLGSFNDGTAILTGTVTALSRQMFTATIGTVGGSVDWTGGTRLDDIAPADQLGWTFVSGVNAMADRVEPGFDEQWDGKVEPEGPIVDIEKASWGSWKATLR